MAVQVRSGAAAMGRVSQSQEQASGPVILVAIYTGTRTEAILEMRFMPNTTGGWVDTDRGMMYRLGQGMTQTKKRQPP